MLMYLHLKALTKDYGLCATSTHPLLPFSWHIYLGAFSVHKCVMEPGLQESSSTEQKC
uniref:Uncharacterized protein n=1 Tax=Arundo donax TaxID=35708 RepID=A0A0A9CDG7_ARUDO